MLTFEDAENLGFAVYVAGHFRPLTQNCFFVVAQKPPVQRKATTYKRKFNRMILRITTYHSGKKLSLIETR